MWLPIFLAHFFVIFTRTPEAFDLALAAAFAYAVQAVVSLFVLRWYKFEPSLDIVSNTLKFIMVAFLATIIAPTIMTLAQMYMDTLTVSPLLNFTRSWGAGIFSALVITPFILSWYPFKRFEPERKELIEGTFAFLLLVATNILIFWTPYAQNFGIVVIFFLPAVFVWFALGLRFRWMTLGILLTAIIGIAGTLLSNVSDNPVNVQLLTVEIYVGLVAAIFFIFAALVEERRTALRHLREAYEHTFASDKAKSEFIAILAHELRNPLAPIVTSLELLRLEPQTREALKTIRSAEQHAHMIRRLLDDLLDTARLTQNKFTLQKEQVSLERLVHESVESVEELIGSKRHRLKVQLPREELMLDVDPVRIKQVLINLISNAGKYTNPGGTIELSCKPEGKELVIRVKDNGIGIDPKLHARIFEPFRQLDSNTHTGAGLGIGLYLTKRLTEMHGGRIEVSGNGSGKGSTFTVYLPLPLERGTPHNATRKPSSEPAIARTKILIVDDNKAAADTLEQLLRYLGQEIEKAYSGHEALKIFDRFKPQMVLLDIGMADINGYQVAEHMRTQGWKGVLVALTGYGQESDRAQSKKTGFDHHLVKPISANDILAIIAGAAKR